jgi:hypothetical protein
VWNRESWFQLQARQPLHHQATNEHHNQWNVEDSRDRIWK